MPSSHSRRSVLALGGVLGAVLAGCLGRGDSTGGLTTTTTTTTTTTAASTPSPEDGTDTPTASPCENDETLVEEMIDVVTYDTVSGFDLTANKETIAKGEQITFRLENVSNEEHMSGNRSKYTIHRETEEGWRGIFTRAPDSGHPAYDDDGVMHQPNEGFTWNVTFSQAGLAHDIENGYGSLTVCLPLLSGIYRFVYWGVIAEEERESDFEQEYALGVRFPISDDDQHRVYLHQPIRRR